MRKRQWAGWFMVGAAMLAVGCARKGAMEQAGQDMDKALNQMDRDINKALNK